MRSIEAPRFAPLFRYLFIFSAGVVLARLWSDIQVSSAAVAIRDIDWQALLSGTGAKISAVLAAASAAYVLYCALRALAPGFEAEKSLSRTQGTSAVARAKILEAVTEGLEKQLSALLGVTTTHMDSNDRYRSAYASAQAGLASADTVEKLQSIGALLISTSAAAQKEAEDLRLRLSAAHAQMIDMRQQLAATEKIAQLDALTGLPNRRHFESVLKKSVDESHATLMPLCLVMADIDHFKAINDTYGHQTGDAVLKQLGDILNGNVRSNDCVARFGGEEFALILRKTPMGSAVEVVERLRARIKEAKWASAKGEPMKAPTASFGLAEIRDHEAGQELLARADKKLYSAKRNGRNRVEIDSAR